jgi:hypothetical protein
MRLRITILLAVLIMIIVACNTATATPEATQGATPATEVPEETTSPSSTPMATENLPALELLSGDADTCAVAEDYSVVLGFNAMYYELTTANRLAIRLLDADGNILVESTATGENKDSEEGWGFYPLAYELPDNSSLTIELTVYESNEDDAAQTSFTSLTWNCTTGETIDSSFERN